uniref:Putative disease resistance protein n=1 Tax=Noccaea caerulescens TaxID=107243 RepID=A0A1J3DVQ9_NOCCA
MASSSSSALTRTWRYRVFTSFHGPDVRKAFLTHLRKQFSYNGISMFDDQGFKRGQTIKPALTQAIEESRISIVVLSKNYACSSWCLDELVEIFKCKEKGQIVMTIFYGVDPRDVRKQIGEFGKVFKKTCAHKTEEQRRKWSKALNDAGNIAGEHVFNWDNESKMIEKIGRDVSNNLIATVSWDFEDMVGIEAHLQKMQSLLDLKYESEAMIVGIYGPAGIGKTTIARALHSRFSRSFPLSYFMENLSGSYNSDLDDYGLKLRLQEKLLSNILNQDGMRIDHLGAIPDRLFDQKVLIILDDVDDLQQLEALANETKWFGPGSRIIVTTEDQDLLEKHGINNTYHVEFPNEEEARKIFCRYAFNQSSALEGFENLVERVRKLCSDLPMGLCVMGSSLRMKKGEDWEYILHRLETSLNPKVEGVLRVGYDNLHKDDQFLFLLIVFFFNYKDVEHVVAMRADNSLDFRPGLKTLADKSLIQISTEGQVVMHKLLQQVGRQAVQSQEPWKRQFLTDAHEICDVLENETGTRNVVGISFDISRISEVSISNKAFKRMPKLRFLKVRQRKDDGVLIPEEMEFPSRLRLLQWNAYPNKCLPPTFRPEYLVELNMSGSELEYLWKGTQKLTNLKKMDLSYSSKLKELPDLSNAISLERLELSHCIKLEVILSHLNLASLEYVNMHGCSGLRNIPVMSKKIKQLYISDTVVEDVPASSISLCSQLMSLDLRSNGKLKEIPHLPTTLTELNLSDSDIEKIPDGINDLHWLQRLYISGCKRLTSLPELPCALEIVMADDCESLETVFCPLNTPKSMLSFINCFKLDHQARRGIIQHSVFRGALLPGREMPAEFDHRASGSSLAIRRPDGYNRPVSAIPRLKVCVVVVSLNQTYRFFSELWCHRKGNGDDDLYPELLFLSDIFKCRTEHLFVFPSYFSEASRVTVFEFDTRFHFFEVIECGAQFLKEECYETGSDQEYDSSDGSGDESYGITDGLPYRPYEPTPN